MITSGLRTSYMKNIKIKKVQVSISFFFFLDPLLWLGLEQKKNSDILYDSPDGFKKTKPSRFVCHSSKCAAILILIELDMCTLFKQL